MSDWQKYLEKYSWLVNEKQPKDYQITEDCECLVIDTILLKRNFGEPLSQQELAEFLHKFARNVLCEPRADTRLCNDIKRFLKEQQKKEAKTSV